VLEPEQVGGGEVDKEEGEEDRMGEEEEAGVLVEPGEVEGEGDEPHLEPACRFSRAFA
jgi:hypothetical protein